MDFPPLEQGSLPAAHGMGEARLPSPSGETSQGETSTDPRKQDRQARSLFKKKKNHFVLVPVRKPE